MRNSIAISNKNTIRLLKETQISIQIEQDTYFVPSPYAFSEWVIPARFSKEFLGTAFEAYVTEEHALGKIIFWKKSIILIDIQLTLPYISIHSVEHINSETFLRSVSLQIESIIKLAKAINYDENPKFEKILALRRMLTEDEDQADFLTEFEEVR